MAELGVELGTELGQEANTGPELIGDTGLLTGFRVVLYDGAQTTNPDDEHFWLWSREIPATVGGTPITSAVVPLALVQQRTVRAAVQGIFFGSIPGPWRDSTGSVTIDPETSGFPTGDPVAQQTAEEALYLAGSGTAVFHSPLPPALRRAADPANGIAEIPLRDGDVWFNTTANVISNPCPDPNCKGHTLVWDPVTQTQVPEPGLFKAHRSTYWAHRWSAASLQWLDSQRSGLIIASEIAAGAIVAEKIAAKAITAGKIDTGAVTATNLNFAAVDATKIVASIKASTEGLTIDARFLDLSGTLRVGSAASDINTGTTLISGGKIKTDELVAGSIDAQKITLAGVRLDATWMAGSSMATGRYVHDGTGAANYTITGGGEHLGVATFSDIAHVHIPLIPEGFMYGDQFSVFVTPMGFSLVSEWALNWEVVGYGLTSFTLRAKTANTYALQDLTLPAWGINVLVVRLVR